MRSIDSIKTYAYETSKELICKKEKIKRSNRKNNTKMFKFDYITKKDI